MGLLDIFKQTKSPFTKLDNWIFDENNIDLFFSQYFSPRKPVLIKGATINWPFMEKWCSEYISSQYGSYQCTVVNDGRPAYSNEKTTLKNYFDNLENKSTLTLEPYHPKTKPVFFNDIPFPNPFFGNYDVARYFFYHSIKDAGTLPHMHRDAFNMLQSGEKRWILHDASPTSCPTGNKTMKNYLKNYHVGSHAKDWFKKEIKTLPKKVTEVYECIQKSGDIVYIPVEYSHAVINHSEVMGLVVERIRK